MTPRLLRGSVPVRAVWLDPRWSTPPALRREALALWEPGALVQELDGGLLVRFPTPRRLDCALAPGLPFVEARDGLWAWSPSAEEASAAAPAHLHRLVRGLVDHVPLAALPDAELWRDLDVDAPIAEVAPLGPPPPPLPTPPRPDVRARFGRPPPDPAVAAIREELAARGTAPVAVGWLPRLAATVLAWMDRRKQAAAAGGLAGAGLAGAGAGGVALPAAPAGPGWLETLVSHFAVPILM
ncbi:MAG: bpX6 domain-containing protein, partial [Myxococcota bacterium]